VPRLLGSEAAHQLLLEAQFNHNRHTHILHHIRSFQSSKWSKCTPSPVAKLALTGYEHLGFGKATQIFPGSIDRALCFYTYWNGILIGSLSIARDTHPRDDRRSYHSVNGRIESTKGPRTAHQCSKS
jgi:hypothetical protein